MSQESQTSTTTITEQSRKHQPPPLYDVIMYNDDVTSMDFVVIILIAVFEYDEGNAIRVMLEIHHSKSKVVGTYPKSVAEFKLEQVNDFKTQFGYENFRVEIRARDK